MHCPFIHIIVLFSLYYCAFTHDHGQPQGRQPSPQQQQQQQQHNGHGGGGKHADQVHDMEHIRHDLEGQVNKPKEEMTPEEQNFYYFKLHDTNNDNRLDGLEVVSAFNHVDHHDDNGVPNNDSQATPPPPVPRLADEELIRLVDDIMREEDMDKDGFISYQEFKRAIEGSNK